MAGFLSLVQKSTYATYRHTSIIHKQHVCALLCPTYVVCTLHCFCLALAMPCMYCSVVVQLCNRVVTWKGLQLPHLYLSSQGQREMDQGKGKKGSLYEYLSMMASLTRYPMQYNWAWRIIVCVVASWDPAHQRSNCLFLSVGPTHTPPLVPLGT